MSQQENVVDVGKDFTKFPAGRTESDGPFSGQIFRDRFLRPSLDKKQRVIVKLDTALGYGSSFLEEAFGGLIRLKYPKEEVRSLIVLDTHDDLLKKEILGYLDSASAA